MKYDTEKYEKLIKDRLSEYRYYHSMCVAKSAVLLAEKYGANEDDAFVAGILHDVMKESSKDEQLEYIKKANYKMSQFEKDNKKVYHQMAGAAFVKLELQIDNDDIINAIKYHTTARAKMSLLEKIIYLADYISDDRDYDDVDIMRKKAFESIESGMLYAMKYTIIDLAKNQKTIHKGTIDAYNEIVMAEKG